MQDKGRCIPSSRLAWGGGGQRTSGEILWPFCTDLDAAVHRPESNQFCTRTCYSLVAVLPARLSSSHGNIPQDSECFSSTWIPPGHSWLVQGKARSLKLDQSDSSSQRLRLLNQDVQNQGVLDLEWPLARAGSVMASFSDRKAQTLKSPAVESFLDWILPWLQAMILGL